MLAPAAAVGREIGPDTDWCEVAKGLSPGEVLVLRPGDYPGGCTLRTGGTPTAPVVIRAKDPEHPPRLVDPGPVTNVINVWASHLILRGLHLGPTSPDVDGIRIYGGGHVVVEDCRFVGLRGIAVVANHRSVAGVVVRRNRISNSEATAMYFGCHDGTTCVVSDLAIESNYIEGVTAPPPAVGYGIQVKLNSAAVIRDNVIIDTKGPGIMLYGSLDPARVSLVERNFVSQSRTSAGIVAGGGPAVVRNNVVVSSHESGIGLEDYAGRGLLQGITVAHNTVYGNRRAGVSVSPSRARLDVRLINNAVHAPTGAPALPSPVTGVVMEGNVDCSHVGCFAAAESLDFSPLPGSRLAGAAHPVDGAGKPQDDFFGRPRPVPATVGAVESPGGPIRLRIKPLGAELR